MRLEGISTAGLPDDVRWFRAWLAARKIVMRPDSKLGESFSQFEQFATIVGGATPLRTTREAARCYYSSGTGWHLLIALLRSAGDRLLDGANAMQLFSASDVLPTHPVRRSKERDLVLELCAAAACATFASEVALAEPDVVCTYAALRRSMACKVLYAKRPETNEDSIVAGADQVQREQVGRGYVFANLADLVPQDEFFPLRGPPPFATADAFDQHLSAWCQSFVGRLAAKEPFVERLRKRHALRGVIFWVPALGDVGGLAVTTIKMPILKFGGPDDQLDRDFERAFHLAFQGLRQQ